MLTQLAREIFHRFGVGVYSIRRNPTIFYPISNYEMVDNLASCFESSFDWDEFSPAYYEKQLENIKNLTVSKIKSHQKLLADLVSYIDMASPIILGIGCGTGIHSKVFELLGMNVEYHGCDISRNQIEVARSYSPFSDRFTTQDACCLNYDSGFFDIAVLEGSIQHVRDYTKALSEATRVANKYVIIHRVTIGHEYQTRFYRRNVGGTIIPEIHFNEHEFINDISKNNLHILTVETIKARHIVNGKYVFFKSYLCSK